MFGYSNILQGLLDCVLLICHHFRLEKSFLLGFFFLLFQDQIFLLLEKLFVVCKCFLGGNDLCLEGSNGLLVLEDLGFESCH